MNERITKHFGNVYASRWHGRCSRKVETKPMLWLRRDSRSGASNLSVAKKHWEHFAHEADMGVRGVGTTPAEAFEQAALALTAVITDPKTVAPDELIEINCEAPDQELLFVDWLNALVYEMATRNMLFVRFEVQIDGQQLRGKAWGEKVVVERHQPAVEIKGATYTALNVSRDNTQSWVAQCVVDV